MAIGMLVNAIGMANSFIGVLIRVNGQRVWVIRMPNLFTGMPVRVIGVDNLATILGFLMLKTGKRGQNVNTRIKMVCCPTSRKF